MPTQERLRKLFEYRDGQLYRLECKGRKHKGDLAGCRAHKGYWIVGIDDYRLLLHRVIWAIHNGPIPAGMVIDHIDHNPSNNKLENLRLVTTAQNNRNLGSGHRTENSPHVGVYKRHNRWNASIKLNGSRKTLHLGTFDTPEEALAARKLIEKEYGFHPNHGKEKATPGDVALAA